ncbi:helix-turn-helix domain-containing protein [Enterococcus sp. DIV0086]|uniref:helix-turn-helix domain-containing protein n=1 Tax=Enterococcus sp. DIV0086 TaxID=2774655 RepID=UPI003D278C1C
MSNLGNKEVMAKNIQYYMDRQGIDRRKLSDDLSISYTTLTDWLKAKTYPRIDKIEMLSNYFSISKADLVEERHPATILTQITDTTAKLEEQRQKEVLAFAKEKLRDQEIEEELEHFNNLDERTLRNLHRYAEEFGIDALDDLFEEMLADEKTDDGSADHNAG